MNDFAYRARRSLWIKVIASSLLLHTLFLLLLYYRPLLLHSPFSSLFSLNDAAPKHLGDDPLLDDVAKTELLQDVFEHLLVLPKEMKRPYDLSPLASALPLSPQEEMVGTDTKEEEPSLPSFDVELASTEVPPLEVAEISTMPLLEAEPEREEYLAEVHIPFVADTSLLPQVETVLPYEDLICIEPPQPVLLPVEEWEAPETAQEMPPSTPLASLDVPRIQAQPVTEEAPLFIPKTAAALPPRAVPLPDSVDSWGEAPLIAQNKAARWDSSFETEITYAEHPEGDGYIFRIALTPSEDLSAHSIPQHTYFLLDRSSSSDKHHFLVFKRATLKALSYLRPDDYFNLFVLDKKVTSFRQQSLPATPANLRLAEAFLDTQVAATSPTNGTIYAVLNQVLDKIPEDTDQHTAILLSDGNATLSPSKRRHYLRKWLNKNPGKLSLYTAAVGRDNSLLWLDLFSTESGGRLLYSDTHAAFPRKLAKLLIDLRDPLIKELHMTARPHLPSAFIELYPTAPSLPALFNKQTYYIYGATDSLSSFELSLQGKHEDDLVAIHKQIDFTQANNGGSAFAREWQRTQAGLCYTEFVERGKVSLLDDAKTLLNRAQKDITF